MHACNNLMIESRKMKNLCYMYFSIQSGSTISWWFLRRLEEKSVTIPERECEKVLPGTLELMESCRRSVEPADRNTELRPGELYWTHSTNLLTL